MCLIKRDLKPANIAVMTRQSGIQNGDVKILDLGMARQQADDPMTGYVSTRWYRAPEILFIEMDQGRGMPGHYDKASDMWAFGCILAEMFMGHPILRGNGLLDQFNRYVFARGLCTTVYVRANWGNFSLPHLCYFIR